MLDFESIRPYHDDEVVAVLTRLSDDPALHKALLHFRFPRLAGPLAWLLRPLIRYLLRREINGVDSVEALQNKLEPYINRVIRKACDGISYSGLERLQAGRAYLFIANHRDIAMDPAFVNYALFHAGFPSARIAIGDNLLEKPFVGDLMRLNKCFLVQRSLTGRREKLAAFVQLSSYINHSIREEGASVWIAQAEGRAKDGDDRTDSAILKMFHMARKEAPFAEALAELHIIPVSISYEYDPCDQAKARELQIRAQTGDYQKAEGEDANSIALGITGDKGRVHIHFGEEITQPAADAKALAAQLDQQILGHYRLFPAHYLAYSQWQGRDEALKVPELSSLFKKAELAEAKQRWQMRLQNCSAAERPFLIEQYARPVANHYALQQGA